jgi:hypothetical protein
MACRERGGDAQAVALILRIVWPEEVMAMPESILPANEGSGERMEQDHEKAAKPTSSGVLHPEGTYHCNGPHISLRRSCSSGSCSFSSARTNG